jgi:hypothetical protein
LLSLSRSPAVGPCGIPPEPDPDTEGARVEVAVVELAAGVEVAAVMVGAGVEVAAVVVGADVEVVAVAAATGCEELAVFALMVFAFALIFFALVVLALVDFALVVLGMAAGCEALVAVVAAGAEAPAVEELEEPDPQPATARHARTRPQLARHLVDRVMAVSISMLLALSQW